MNRRHFLKSCLAAGAVATLPGFAFAAPGAGLRTQSRLLMGTVVSISAAGASRGLADDAMGRAFERIELLETVFNRHDGASALGVLNTQGSLKDAPAALCALLDESLALHRASGGAFDVSVAPLVDLMESGSHFDSRQFAEAKALADISAIRLSGPSIRLEKSGMALTLDGIAKGAIVDAAARSMREAGVENFLINAGGDIYASGQKAAGQSWKVAVESPEKDGNYPAVITLSGRGMATSGGYERLGHLISPQNGISARLYKSVSVTAPTVKEADALATALSAMPLMQAKAFVSARPGCAALFIDNGGKIHSSNWA